MTAWILGILCALFALLGAVLAANALDTGMYVFGLGLVVFGLWFDFWLMKTHFDEADRHAA